MIATQLAPVAVQRCHWYVNATGFAPLQVPGTPASTAPALGVPTTEGAVATTGAPPPDALIANVAGFVPFSRSPSLQCTKPGILEQSVHCQNVQPMPAQFAAGTLGAAFFVQCAIQSRLPAVANAVVLPSAFFQKLGDA